MGVIYVARSAKFSKWASDVGLGKHVFKVGLVDGDPKSVVEKGWASEADWTLVKKREVEALTEEEALARLARKEKIVDPVYYPRLRGAIGIFKVSPEHVENHILIGRVMAGGSERLELKLKPGDFAEYLIQNALR
jgi:hypothetical protein